MSIKTDTKPVIHPPTRRGGLPDSWIKAAGILRKSAKKNVAELKKNRREWDARMKAFENGSRA